MNKAFQVRDAFRDMLRSIPELVSMMGNDPERIFSLTEGRLADVSYNLPTPSLLVAFTGARSRGEREHREFFFRCPFKYDGEPDELWRIFQEGKPAASAAGLSMFQTELKPGLHSMEFPELVLVTEPLGNGMLAEWWEIQTSFVDRLW